MVFTETTNLSIVNNKSKSKQHQVLLLLHRSWNMSFVTKMLLAMRTRVHIHCTKNADFFDIVGYFFGIFSWTRSMRARVHMWISGIHSF
jgi:hypothetical protein